MKKSDFTPDEVLSDFIKIDTLVIFNDNSYVTNEKGLAALPALDEGPDVFKVIDGNKAFPTNNTHAGDRCLPINNIKVQNIVTGKIYHCSNINILSIETSNNENGERQVIYKGAVKTISDVFFNPYPFL